MRIGKEVLILNLDDVLPNRFQPRITFDEKAIMELTESIKEHGVIQPIVVRRVADKYEIIAGERRYKASVLAGKKSIPAILADLNDRDSAEVALIENVQRQDLTPIEEAISYKKILDMGYLNQVDLANKLGKTQSTIANKLRLLNLCDEVQEALMKEKISERHARSLLKLNKEQQKIMLSKIISERLTVRKTDEEIEKMLNNSSDDEEEKVKENNIEENKGENKMNNNSQDTNNFNVQSSPIFPGFATTNIEESQPINFNSQSKPIQPQQSFENTNKVQTDNIFGNFQNISNQEPIQMHDNSDIFSQVQNNQQQNNQQQNNQQQNNQQQNNQQPMYNQSQNNQPQNNNNSELSNIFGSIESNEKNKNFSQPEVIPSKQNEQIFGSENQSKPEENRFFGLFNNSNLNETTPNSSNTSLPNNEVQTNNLNFNNFNIENQNNNLVTEHRIDTNNILNQSMNQQQNNENNYNPFTTQSFENNQIDQTMPLESIQSEINSQIERPIQPVIEPQVESKKIEPVIQPAIEELNFDEEIKPVQPFTLDDNQNFNNQNSQILSQSSSPVAIITPKEIPELQPIMPEQEQTKYGTINDMINIIRDSIDRVESNGYIVDSDEMDLQNSYQIVITIQK